MTTPAFNCVFGWPIRNDPSVSFTPAYSGGAWSAGNPLTNLSDRRLQKPARSTNVLAASTQFEVDLQTARDIRVLAIYVINATAAATVRFRGSNVAHTFGSPVYDSTATLILPAGRTAEQLQGLNVWQVFAPATVQTARYWLVEIVDTANPAGFVDVGRAIIADGWQPSINMAWGTKLGLETDTERDDTDGSTAVFNIKPVRRTIQFDIADLPTDEALTNAFDMMRIASTSGQIHFVFDPTDTTHMHRRNFLLTLRRLNALEYVNYGSNTVAFEGVEEL